LSAIERSTLVRAPRSRVWQAPTSIQEFSKWFCVETEGEFAPGAQLHMISTHDSGKGVEFFIDVARMDAPEVFRSPACRPRPRSIGTPSGVDRLSLERTRAFEENDKGWEIQLASLTRHAGQAA